MYITLTSWYFTHNIYCLTTLVLWKCCNTNFVECTEFYLEAKRIVGVSSGGVDNLFTSVHVGNSEVVEEITEYTSSWWRVPNEGTEWWTEPYLINTTNTCIKPSKLIMRLSTNHYKAFLDLILDYNICFNEQLVSKYSMVYSTGTSLVLGGKCYRITINMLSDSSMLAS